MFYQVSFQNVEKKIILKRCPLALRDCQNYLKLTLEHGGANDNALAEALENLAKCGNKKVTNGVVNRLQREAQFIRTGNSFLG